MIHRYFVYELYKITNSNGVVILLLLPLLLVSCDVVYLWIWFPDYLSETKPLPINPYLAFANILYKSFELLYPIWIAVLCSECYKINTSTHRLTLDQIMPCSSVKLLSCRFTVVVVLMASSILFSYCITIIGLKLLCIYLPYSSLNDYNMTLPLMILFIKIMYLGLGLILIQYSLNHLTKSIIVPLFFVSFAVLGDIGSNNFPYYNNGLLLKYFDDFYYCLISVNPINAIKYLIVPTIILLTTFIYHEKKTL